MKPYYEDDAVTIYHGDCREVLPTLPPVDLVLTDPPYGIDLGNHADSRETRRGVGLKKQGYGDYIDTHANFLETIVPGITLALSLAMRGMVFCADTRIWDLPKPDAVTAIYLPSGQGRTRWGFRNLAHLLLYGTAPNLNLGAKNTAMRSTATAEKNGHPCPKPLEWIKWAVALGSCEGDTILDPFMGSGTTLRAAKDLGRKAIGIEIEERYCEIAAQRMAQTVMNALSEERKEQRQNNEG